MNVPLWVWAATIVGIAAVLIFDVWYVGRRPHEPSMREAGLAIGCFISLALVFGLGILVFSGGEYAKQFYVGWITEYTLSVDNLFVFIIIMGAFGVPRRYQQTALLIGIIIAIVLRGVFIIAGYAAISAFSWVFYLFGIFLLFTAVRMAMHQGREEEDYQENAFIRWTKRRLPASGAYNGVRLTVVEHGRRLLTPMFFVILALGSADVMFALDSIPAIYAFTQEPFLIFTANFFALMGLRQLYFLIGGLLIRLVYLSIGLAVLLGFIGVKLVLHAMEENTLPFINGGQPVESVLGVPIPHIGIEFSLGFIVATIAVVTVASLLADKRRRAKVETPTPG